jgi:MOSC domain-containing protein YiiM
MVKRFLRSGRTGYYLAVLVEGDVAAPSGSIRENTCGG